LQKQEQNKDSFELIKIVDSLEYDVIRTKNAQKYWDYGYNEKYDFVVISKTGEIGEIVEIQGLRIALPKEPDDVYKCAEKAEDQVWFRSPYPAELAKVKSRSQWKDMPRAFKLKWTEYIEQEFIRRDEGFWFMNNGRATYITGSHYFYLQWASIDVGYPEYREANRALFLFWEACKADERSFGMCYLKIRRSGFSFMTSAEIVNQATLSKDSHLGILSKTGKDAQSMFTKKVVPINSKLPFFFKPIQDGMDKPKTELSYQVPATKITKKNMDEIAFDEDGLNTIISWRNTDDNSYDSEKLLLLSQDEAFKWEKPNSILNSWRVTKTCLRLGGRIIGKCMMGSTCNALAKGGQNGKDMYYDSDVSKRNPNGQTKSGLYALFIPMEWNTEGYIDKYGMPVFRKPAKAVKDTYGRTISKGAIDWWEGEVESKKSDPDDLNEFYRQFPRTESHAFRDESKQSLFNLTRIYQQIDYNDSIFIEHEVTRGNFKWENGIKDTMVYFEPEKHGRFLLTWIPPKSLQNRYFEKYGIRYPANEHLGAFGCDPYDITGTVGGGGSKGSLHGLTKFHMDEAPTNTFFLEYIARPQTAEMFFEDVLMACVFYGMPMLAENNKPRLLYHFKNRGYRGFSMNRPDKVWNKLSKSEKELGGIPSASEDVKQSHASAIESYIDKYIGYDMEGKHRDRDAVGNMYFNRTLEDWARFDITNREKHDATISSGYAIMACQKHLYIQEKKNNKISINFARYDNTGLSSRIL
jgi:hypothetical protein